MPERHTRVPIGVRVAMIREHRGLTQTALARKVGASQSAISQIESGDRSPSWAMLEKLADALGARLSFALARRGAQRMAADEGIPEALEIVRRARGALLDGVEPDSMRGIATDAELGRADRILSALLARIDQTEVEDG